MHPTRPWLVGLVIATLCLLPSAAAAEESPGAPAAEAASDDAQAGAAQTPEPLDDERRYAELEAASPQAAEFEGGGVGVYVGTGALVVAAAIVLLIVLL